MKHIVRSQSRPAVGAIAKESEPVTWPEIVGKLHLTASSKKQSGRNRPPAPGAATGANGIMPEDLERAAREQENHIAVAGRPKRRKRAS
jgi:hypothetical protein